MIILSLALAPLLSAQETPRKPGNEQKVTQEQMAPLLHEIEQASANGDVAAMKAALAKIENLDPDSPYLPMLRLEVDIAKPDWEAAAANLAKMEGPRGVRSLGVFTSRVLQLPANFPEPFQRDLAATFDRLLANEQNPDSYSCVMLACLKLSLGDREGAIAAAKKGAETVGGPIPREPLDRFVKELETGNSPTPDVILAWVREAMNARPQPNDRSATKN